MSKKYYAVIGLMLILFAVTGCGQSISSQLKENTRSSVRYLEENDYEQAVVAFNKVIALDEKQIEAYLGLADVYIAQEEFEQAQAVLTDGLNNCEDSRFIQEKIKEVEELIQARETAAVSRAVDIKLQELGESLGYMDAPTYTTEKQGISSYVLCDVDADGVEELLVTYMSGTFTGDYDSCDLWASLYDYQDGQMILTAEQQIGWVDYCDAMTVRLIFSEQQAAFCIVTNKESIRSYTGVRDFVSELYRISNDRIELRKHWSQNSMENLNDSPDMIIAEMQRAGIPYIDMNYFNYGTEDASDAEEQILFQNQVGAEGTDVDAAEREYGLYFSTYEELLAENNTDEFFASEEQLQLIRSRTSEGIIQEDELKEVCRPQLVTIQNLFRGCYGAVINRDDEIFGPGYPAYDDIYAAAVDFTSMEELKAYVRSMVSDSLYEQYFNGEKFIEQDGKLYLPCTTYGGSMDLDSLEIESIDGDLYTVSVNEYLGHEYYIQTNFITLQKTENGWFVLDVTDKALYDGNTRRYDNGSEGDFL